MSDFSETWDLVRGRFIKEYSGLSSEQLNWRMHPTALTIGEAAIHVYGVETFFISQLLGSPLDEFGMRVMEASKDGVVNENTFPFKASEITPDLVGRAERMAFGLVSPVITNLTDDTRGRQIKSALGPIIDGAGAMARLSYHPGYHQGQVYLIKKAPGFPAG